MRDKKIFHFKQFTIRQEHTAMKVGTDGVLLGAWADVTHAKRILDIGTGTGLMALMLAQRTAEETRIDAIEIEQHAFEEACFNIEQSVWSNRVTVHHQSLQEFSNKPYDLIVCNPPFFLNSLKPPNEKRVLARHADMLPMNMLAMHCKRLLSDTGIVSIIIPYLDQTKIKSIFIKEGLHCFQTTLVRTVFGKRPERCMLSFDKKNQQEQNDEIVLHDKNRNRTEAYTELTKDFYLKL